MTTVTNPQLPYDSVATQSTYLFSLNYQLVETKIYQGTAAGTPIRRMSQSWNTNGTPWWTNTYLPSGLTSSTFTNYDDFGNLWATRQRDWGTLSWPTIRTVRNFYDTSSQYTNLNIRNLLTKTEVWEGDHTTGTLASLKEYAYDDYTTNPITKVSGAAQHDDANYVTAFETRWNITIVTVYEIPATPAKT